MPPKKVAIVNYGMGNLFSVKHACLAAGLFPWITDSPAEISKADALILPGVGAFGEAMKILNRLGLSTVIREFVEMDKPVMGICLGMQLLMTRSFEFGKHEGLNIIEGEVVSLKEAFKPGENFKVPHVTWNKNKTPEGKSWKGSMLDGMANGQYMYFVHSYFVTPRDTHVVLSSTQYGGIVFCSSLQYKNVFACQYHPERSGPAGLKIYCNFANFIQQMSLGGEYVRAS
ncbi:MAG: imidazole glycerol phosphate synthase, glutamine amidotransferase subunit [Deltaproteobacteria bacterium RIFCSPLOWO2_01_44_7]|nr:MAG: imidazole glycerol phosphate synthase, glutamine amidotransferase subunit [Deltaproteobacteria bacterium RIFCSPHIGHO2_01_FULL_43_49]OGQ16113.1 MAG: imidazole glycerol phosphate synthase, glutamine amidotransferase subunit [Deltaproteobacteria bacterium RIFCSPHIGHO2_02_FULL_44_53]OGQ29074.1 MAG: imidazole glycerol phosphate synthase, glutamine amidotransferase subunit [Deltaproteobacteria bacterium RIFCSPHIGHO2_12_FULL_44_21]OGQ32630.1 MAG: imidazole glycerol phosphate synthase, glutamine